jgi:hypothetical protein
MVTAGRQPSRGAGDPVPTYNPILPAQVNTAGYSCLDDGNNPFPPNARVDVAIAPGQNDQVTGGFKPFANVRILATIDYGVSQNVMVGGRVGYVLPTMPAGGAFAPLHIEARLTYLVGRGALTKKGVTPMVFVGAGAGEFDAAVPITAIVRPLVARGNPQSVPVNAWITAGPGFFTGGGGIRYLLGAKAAFTAALKLEGAFGGSAGFLPGVAPELGLQFGF